MNGNGNVEMISGGAGHFTNSQRALEYLQEKYGSANYANWQSLRYDWYSYVDYTANGQTEYRFFSDVPGQGSVTRQDTNMRKAGTFGQTHFLLKAIRTNIRIADWEYNDTVANDADTLYSDIVNGFVQDGVLELSIGSRTYAQIPRPFMFAPPADGRPSIKRAGMTSLTLSAGTPDTFSSVVQKPYANLCGGRNRMYKVDPIILIEAEQSFEVSILFSNAISLIASDVNNDSTNPLKIGVILSGIQFRPVQ